LPPTAPTVAVPSKLTFVGKQVVAAAAAPQKVVAGIRDGTVRRAVGEQELAPGTADEHVVPRPGRAHGSVVMADREESAVRAQVQDVVAAVSGCPCSALLPRPPFAAGSPGCQKVAT
jgi:hypothetical protein